MLYSAQVNRALAIYEMSRKSQNKTFIFHWKTCTGLLLEMFIMAGKSGAEEEQHVGSERVAIWSLVVGSNSGLLFQNS